MTKRQFCARYQRLAASDNGKFRLVTAVGKFQQDFLAGKATLTAELMAFLREWLINHVFKTDKTAVIEISARPKPAAVKRA